jgi:sulfite exporter TauE/SafE
MNDKKPPALKLFKVESAGGHSTERAQMMIAGFLLGLSNGATCLATCAVVLVPLFLGEGRRAAENGSLLARFLAGRLAGYLLFGLLAWAANWLILRDSSLRSGIFGAAYVLLAGLMLAYGLGRLNLISCAVTPRELRARFGRFAWLRPWLPALFGLLTGLNLCPPFLAAFTNAALNGTLLGSLLFFLAFFAGTSFFLLPIPLVGLFRQPKMDGIAMNSAMQTVGRLAAILMSVFYIVSGVLLFFQGVVL